MKLENRFLPPDSYVAAIPRPHPWLATGVVTFGFSSLASCRSLLSSTFSAWMQWLISSSYWSPAEGSVIFVILVEILDSLPKLDPKSMGPLVATPRSANFVSSPESYPKSMGLPHANPVAVAFSSSSNSKSWLCCMMATTFYFPSLSFLSGLSSGCIFQQVSSSCHSFPQCVQEVFSPLLLTVVFLFHLSSLLYFPLFSM